MNKDLKDLIDEAEEKQETRAYLEKTIEKLKTELASLKRKVEEQKPKFKVEPVRHSGVRDESEEITILKDMISSLRDKFENKVEENERLQEKVQDLTKDITKLKESMSDKVKDEMLLRTQNSLNTLIQDYAKLENENKLLKKNISELRIEIEPSSETTKDEESKIPHVEKLNEEVSNLRLKISHLESRNKSLLDDLNKFKSKGTSEEDLEKLLENLKENNVRLQRENQTLSENLQTLKREKLRIFKYESKISELNRQIQDLKIKNKELRQKDSVLLAKTITALQKHDQKEKSVLDSNVLTISKLPSKPIHKETEQKITKVEIPTKKEKVTLEEKKEILPVSKPVEIIDLKKLSADRASDDEIIRKWQCPKCGNTNKTQIRETDDKTRLIYAYPRIYAKKYKCGQCGAEWR